ncbi:hypothetical protein R1flu_016586 [Riccia fluitans]|uniref:Uncharacterized protein n=1 Tax=Riccia fluitans TaxID=41844 RepID=A0ABD1YN39_9MARC
MTPSNGLTEGSRSFLTPGHTGLAGCVNEKAPDVSLAPASQHAIFPNIPLVHPPALTLLTYSAQPYVALLCSDTSPAKASWMCPDVGRIENV